MVLTGEGRVHQPAGAQLDKTDFFENFLGISRHGLFGKKFPRSEKKDAGFSKLRAPELRQRFAR
jgi:hypothetical protein